MKKEKYSIVSFVKKSLSRMKHGPKSMDSLEKHDIRYIEISLSNHLLLRLIGDLRRMESLVKDLVLLFESTTKGNFIRVKISLIDGNILSYMTTSFLFECVSYTNSSGLDNYTFKFLK